MVKVVWGSSETATPAAQTNNEDNKTVTLAAFMNRQFITVGVDRASCLCFPCPEIVKSRIVVRLDWLITTAKEIQNRQSFIRGTARERV
jgi:hypothetical protein